MPCRLYCMRSCHTKCALFTDFTSHRPHERSALARTFHNKSFSTALRHQHLEIPLSPKTNSASRRGDHFELTFSFFFFLAPQCAKHIFNRVASECHNGFEEEACFGFVIKPAICDNASASVATALKMGHFFFFCAPL